MQQVNDTIVLDESGQVEVQTLRPRHKLTPREVLSWLPADATPAQQDSAIQANFQPGEIHWSTQPDTLHLPGMPAGRSWRDVSLPQYYRESYFTGKPWFHPELFGGRVGVAGDPVPYSIARDNVITLLLVACFVLTMLALSRLSGFMLRQAKDFFRTKQGGATTEVGETGAEVWFQNFLVAQTCLLAALVYFFHVELHVANTFTVDQYQVIGIFAAMAAGFVVLKMGVYHCVNVVFFDAKTAKAWTKALLFVTATEGLLLYPIVLLQAYFGLPQEYTLVGAAVVGIIFELLLFYKSQIIFFSRTPLVVQNILYFCMLEVVPVAAVWGALGIVSNFLKVNF